MRTSSETVTQLFVATDNKEWNKVEELFADEVVLDYSSMSGNPAATLSPKQITDSWKTILPGFTATHHQVGNFINTEHESTSEVFCYGTATHFLKDEQGNVWTVVGSYNFELKMINDQWKITKMKFNFKYQDGNTSLPAKAIEIVKQK